ncbi:MAG: 2Fe-2S iron-sulfur cluster binding domain-containing protein [Candidatus Latescibacteria bacterium]|nr:2Fe-2S iron-sulfur cluster binding domain-containing protein [Candidatus Latescibacterota bacterium]
MAEYDVTLITPDGETFHLRVDEPDYLLDAARRAGITLPSMCLQGWCLTCASRIVEGQVDQSEAVRFYEEDEAAGFVLLCSAHPRSNLTILTHQRVAMRDHRLAHDLPAPRG